MQTLSAKERQVLERMQAGLFKEATPRPTKTPLIIALVGVVGSGKSQVAKMLAQRLGAVVVEGDRIRVELRKLGQRFEQAWQISAQVAQEVIRCGGNVVLDSDHVLPGRRQALLKIAEVVGARVFFIRTVANLDVMIGRIMVEPYGRPATDFFGGASTSWTGPNKGAVVKNREKERRLPHHYHWIRRGGGTWIPRNFSSFIFAMVDTTEEIVWRAAVNTIAQELAQL